MNKIAIGARTNVQGDCVIIVTLDMWKGLSRILGLGLDSKDLSGHIYLLFGRFLKKR